MSQPTTYVRAFNFTNQQAVTPSTPLPADKVDLELNLVKTSLDETQANLALIQRDDGAVKNNSIGYDQFKAEVSTGFNPPAPWLTVTNYISRDTVFIDAAFYLCEQSHISGVFATDLAAGKWSLVADLSSVTTGLPAVPVALDYLRRNASNSGYEGRTPEQVLTDIGGEKEINAAAEKTTPVDADELGLWDSVSELLNKVTWANLKATFFAALGPLIVAATSKTTPVDADHILIADSAASDAPKKVTLANLKAAIWTFLRGTYLTPWAAFTPVFTGFGTPSGVSFSSRRVGDTLEIMGRFTSGTSTATEARMSLLLGVTSVTVDGAKIPSVRIAGIAGTNTVGVRSQYVLVEGAVSYITFSAQTASRGPLDKMDGNAFASSGDTVSVQASVPIVGW